MLNNTLANDDISELVNKDLDASLQITIPLTFAILLIAFGAVVAAAVPLVLAMTALLAAFGVLGLYSQFVTPVSPYASQLVVLIGLAVAVDYSLFMLTRFRSERRRHPQAVRPPTTRSDYIRRVVLALGAIIALIVAVGVDSAPVRLAAAAVIGGIVVWSIARLMEHGDDTEKMRAIQTRIEHGRPGGVLLGSGGDDLDRGPVPARRPAVPLDGDRDDLGGLHLGRRLADVPAGRPVHPRRGHQRRTHPDHRPAATRGQRDVGAHRSGDDAPARALVRALGGLPARARVTGAAAAYRPERLRLVPR